MTTFLPYESFLQSALTLDRARLGKQRVEVLQLVRGHLTPSRWSNHPASKMWVGHTNALIDYGIIICEEWMRRGYADTVKGKLIQCITSGSYTNPSWLGDERFHQSQRDVLMAKMPAHYLQFGWEPPLYAQYLWPEFTKDGYRLVLGSVW